MDGQIYFLCKMYCYFENSSLDVKYHWTKYLPIDTEQVRYSLSEKDAQDVKNKLKRKDHILKYRSYIKTKLLD
jgi:hypothetical protein